MRFFIEIICFHLTLVHHVQRLQLNYFHFDLIGQHMQYVVLLITVSADVLSKSEQMLHMPGSLITSYLATAISFCWFPDWLS